MEEIRAMPLTGRQVLRVCRLEASLIFTPNQWGMLLWLKKRFGDKTHAHLIKRALALLENVGSHVRNDNLYVLTRPPRKGEIKAGEVIKIKV
mgnify:CR=1 FL=1